MSPGDLLRHPSRAYALQEAPTPRVPQAQDSVKTTGPPQTHDFENRKNFYDVNGGKDAQGNRPL